ncbi:MAG TPA: molecular chaperone DnaK [Kutzneria sp.]|nr:molecular chaperone DnaK [Kutzneria sp.]
MASGERLPDLARSRAVLIGVARYRDDNLHDLHGALGNVQDLADRLGDERTGSFRRDCVTTVPDPEHAGLLGEMVAAEARQAQDTFLVYYAGHGLLDAQGRLYLGLTTTNSESVFYSAMPFDFIRQAFLNSPARNRILILDCCFSGRAIEAMSDRESVVSGQIEISGVYTLTSAPANQPAIAPDGARHTAFTGELLRLLNHGVATGSELITLEQIYVHLLAALTAGGLPKPQRRGTGTSDLLALARNPAWPASSTQDERGSLPVNVMRLLEDHDQRIRRGAVDLLAVLADDPNYADQAFTTLTHLTDDDSRMVSAAAQAALRNLEAAKQAARREPEPHAAPPPVRDEPAAVPTSTLSVGISFGTTNSAISVLRDGKPIVVPNAEGQRTTPSVVSFARDGKVLVGEPARRAAVTNVDRTVRSVKQHLGTDWRIRIDEKTYTAQEIAARVLMKLKRDAEVFLGAAITDVVATVPAHFGDAQRLATLEAGRIAGLNIQRILNEPTAAALSYGLGRGDEEHTIIVFDLGGGAFDVSLVELGDGVIEVRTTNGDTTLGGEQFDRRIVEWLVRRFKAATGVDLSRDRTATQRLMEAAEKAKIELSSINTATVALPYISADNAGNPLFLEETLSRAEFERMTADLLDRTRPLFRQVIEDAELAIGDIDHVVLAGGATRMPAVADLVRQLTGGKEPYRGLDRDEAVAMGAAVQAGVLVGEISDVLPLDVTPLSLGIETKGGVFTKLIERNTTLPCKRTEVFTTADDNQPSVQIQVFQGEREIAAHNKKLGQFELRGIAPAPRGVPQIEVTFDIDPNGIVHVYAKDLGTGKEQSITITGGSALPVTDIERMVADAATYAEQDRVRRDETESRLAAESLIYQSEQLVTDNAGTLPLAVRQEVHRAVEITRRALDANSPSALRSAVGGLTSAVHKASTALYQQRS